MTGADLSARDNAALGVAMTSAIAALSELRDRCVIDDAELVRMVYRFAGEVADVEALLERGKRAGKRMTSNPDGMQPVEETQPEDKQPSTQPASSKVKLPRPSQVVDKESGEAKGAAAIYAPVTPGA